MLTNTNRFYNRFFRFYPLVHLFLQPQKLKLYAAINALPPGNLLDIGVGNGADLAKYEHHQITGIDNSSKMLERAQAKKNPNIELLEMDANELAFPDGHFSYVVLSHVIAVVKDPEQLLSEIFRILKPGGQLFILNHFTPDNGLRYVDRCFQPFAKLLQFNSYFRLNSLQTLQQFLLVEETSFGKFSYFKLLVYCKP
ncbi:MAG: class I SAM-dependent methyltransferase [Chitinophagaceae bacterium]|nr:MAG: class I SAM-dependent methyltransferase [Chitinophagaceae bacterium]